MKHRQQSYAYALIIPRPTLWQAAEVTCIIEIFGEGRFVAVSRFAHRLLELDRRKTNLLGILRTPHPFVSTLKVRVSLCM